MNAGPKASLDLAPEDVDWQDVGIGRYATWHLTWDEESNPVPLFAIVEYAPNAVVAAHYHTSDYASYVVKGDLTVTRRHHGAGSVRFVRSGTAYGPIEVGPEGATVIEVFRDAQGGLPHWLGDTSEQAQFWPAEFTTAEEWFAAERDKRRLRPKARSGSQVEPGAR